MKNDSTRSRGEWLARISVGGHWREVQGALEPYSSGGLVEWGSVTKSAVAATVPHLFDLEARVCDVSRRFVTADYTVADLIGHTAGLPRVGSNVGGVFFRDPYARTSAREIASEQAKPTRPAGSFLYSNLGYAILGDLLDGVDGDWFEACRRLTLAPAVANTATIRPEINRRVLLRGRRGRVVQPWSLSDSAYSSAGGLWSTFDDLCRFATWSLEDERRLLAWQSQGADRQHVRWINGQTKSSGVAIVAARDRIAVIHTLGKRPGAADRIAGEVLRMSSGALELLQPSAFSATPR